MISEFRGKNRFLSNFYQSLIEYDGFIYQSVEHAYQASKTHDMKLKYDIYMCNTPAEAKLLGRKLKLRSDWSEVKIEIMRILLYKKFENETLRNMLLNTGDEELIEGNNHGDDFWGCVYKNNKLVGENNLGKLLMEIRNNIKNNNIYKSTLFL